MTNFEHFKIESRFDSFVDVAISAEKIINIDTDSCIINCRRAMEFAIKWMYSVDRELEMPYQDNLASLLHTDEFKDIVGIDIWRRLDLIRRLGNNMAHSAKKSTVDQAKLCLNNLFVFFDFVACCYSSEYEVHEFDEELLKNSNEQVKIKYFDDIDLKSLIEENKKLKETLSDRREKQQPTYVEKPLELSEYETRKIYIDSMLKDAGWVEGKDWLNEVELKGMTNKLGIGYADYVLYDDMARPIAIIEAKKTCKSVSEGREQANLYANILEKKFGRRPVIFLTNGFETRIIDGKYPERICSNIYSKRDLEKWFNLLSYRDSLDNIDIDKNIAGRYYQESAIRAVCDAFEKNRRKALLVMATGSGKTRTVIELCDILLKKGWIKNILFLADRNSLVTQAKRNFVNLLPSLSCTNLCEDKHDKDSLNSRCIFSTYQTMIGVIDDAKDEYGKIFSCGHFDLIICDEAHRSIYNKYKDIFTYFDAPLVGLTATPKDEIDKNTYSIFELEDGVPTYGYELAQAVKDGFLVDFKTVETTLKLVQQGVVYDDLSDEDKLEYENTFKDVDGNLPDKINASAINSTLFNYDTIKKVLDILMRDGLRVDYGEKIGKTVIFAKNHAHAEKILEVFKKEYPYLRDDFAKVIDNYINFSQKMIDDFSDAMKMPQIAISVDMLDTGIDVPEILNLVFFKPVMSKAKFWQMIGRGTRLCPNLCDGNDKDKFYIFDFCSNFEFFRMNPGHATPNNVSLSGAIFNIKFDMAYKLQDMAYQNDDLIEYRKELVKDMIAKVNELNRDSFAIKQHIKYIDLYSDKNSYNSITYEDTLAVREEVGPYILPDDDVTATRFDALMYHIELASLSGQKYGRHKSDLIKKLRGLASVATGIPDITKKTDFIKIIINTDYLDRAGMDEFERIRVEFRELMKYLPKSAVRYDTNFTDDIIDVQWHDFDLENDDLKNYKAKAEYYVRQNQDNIVIAKLKTNKQLTKTDLENLEKILWSEIGTRKDYEKEYGEKPLGEFVRSIVGLDMNSAKEAFSNYLSETNLDSRQIYFVNQIVEYIVKNGILKDFSVLQDSPFTDMGNISELFSDDMNTWLGIKNVIQEINTNAVA